MSNLSSVLVRWLPDPALRMKRQLLLGEKWGTQLQTLSVDAHHPSYPLALALAQQEGPFFVLNVGFAGRVHAQGDTWVLGDVQGRHGTPIRYWREAETRSSEVAAKYNEELLHFQRTGTNRLGEAAPPPRPALGSPELSPRAAELLEFASNEWMMDYAAENAADREAAEVALLERVATLTAIVDEQRNNYLTDIEQSIKREAPHALFDMEAFNKVAQVVPVPAGGPFAAVPPPAPAPPPQPPPPTPPAPLPGRVQTVDPHAPPQAQTPATVVSDPGSPARVVVGNVVKVDPEVVAKYSTPAADPAQPQVQPQAQPAANPAPPSLAPKGPRMPPGFG